MKQMKIAVMRRLFFYLFMSVGYLCGLCQELTDTLNISKMNTDSFQLRLLLLSPEVRFNIEKHVPDQMVNLSDSVLNNPVRYNENPIVPNSYLTPEQSGLFSWNKGGIFISGRSVTYPGLMAVDNGTLGLYQSFGNLNFSLGVTANKYGWYQGLSTQYGLNGNLNYHFTPKLSATFYAIYYMSKPPFMANGMPLPPSMLGYYVYTRFGGYVDYKVNERIGMQFGGQIVKRTYSNRYEAEPIATPYITVGRKKKIGIGLPVGQILQGLFWQINNYGKVYHINHIVGSSYNSCFCAGTGRHVKDTRVEIGGGGSNNAAHRSPEVDIYPNHQEKKLLRSREWTCLTTWLFLSSKHLWVMKLRQIPARKSLYS